MDFRDVDLERSGDGGVTSPEPPRRTPWIWVALGIALVVGAAAYLMTTRREPVTDRPPSTEVSPVQPSPPARTDRLGGDGEAIDLPPLDASDAIVRELVRKLSSHPTVAAWLTTDNLLRRFTASVQNIAAGRSPATHARRLAPTAPFAVTQRNGQLVMDPRSYQRYDGIAAAVESIDPAGAARLYATLRPRLEEAHAELGTEASLDGTLERAIYVLLQTPVVEDPVRLEMKGVNYVYADPQLEQLTPAQKHLLRMGPRNMRIVQSKLRQIAGALGIPEQRLPGAS